MNKAIFELYKTGISNPEIPHKKVLVCFAGPPGSGKSNLAKHLEVKFSAIRLSNDKVRNIIDQLDPNVEPAAKQRYVQDFLDFFVEKAQSFANQLIILDSGIERKYQRVFELADKYGYQKFVVDFEVSRAELEQRIKAEKNNPADYLVHLDDWIKQHKAFRQQVEPDLVIKATTAYGVVDTKLNNLLEE